MKAILKSCLTCVWVLMAFASTLPAYAASGTGKRINDIKLSGSYFYAESTDQSEAAAKNAANTFLANFINQYIADNSLTHDRVMPESIPGIKYLTMKRNSGIRVFAYVEKDVILQGETPAPQPDEDEEEESVEVVTAVEDVAADSILADIPDTFLVEEQTSATPPASSSQSTSAAPADDENNPEFRARYNTLLSLVEIGSLSNALKALQRLDAEYIVKRYGPYNKCPNKMWAFWMIYDATGTTLEAFLSPGAEGERINMLTGSETDSLDNYTSGKDKLALFFEFR